MERRDFIKTALTAAGTAALGSASMEAAETRQPIDNRKISSVAFPEKRPLITYSDRPPLLESPRDIFAQAITPNDMFFVRWHMPDIPTLIDPETYTIHINGLVEKELHISLNDLKTKTKTTHTQEGYPAPLLEGNTS
jgi:sulfoxide reductase catalytic subunit YedY